MANLDNMNNNQSAFIDADGLYDKQTKPVPVPEKNIGIDTDQELFWNIIGAAQVGKLDINALESFTRVSQSRDQVYNLIDMMSEDSRVSPILEAYAEDATEYNSSGQIVWAESQDPDVSKHVNFILESCRVDKNIYNWVHSLCKYGDCYLRLYRESDYDQDDLFIKKAKEAEEAQRAKLNESKENLKEDVKIKVYSKNDNFKYYLEKVPNPAEMFELTKFGKTYGYIKAEVSSLSQARTSTQAMLDNNYFRYRFKSNDVELYEPTTFVHACLEDNSSRTPEEVSIFTYDENIKTDDGQDKEVESTGYTVKRGESLLYNTFKVWRELALLENSVLLNRVTKSAIVRIIGIEVGDMAKDQVAIHLQQIKALMEQKASLDTGKSMNEYTNPGPIENNIYVPTRNGKGAITTSQVGGDVNVGQLVDLDHFQDKFYGAMRVPKQYFGVTDDNAGFSGGQSLTIISSRYAKMIKRIQNAIIQALTDAINIYLMSSNLDTYVNNFTIKMTPPTTQEDIDRRDNTAGKIQLTSDIMTLITDIEDQTTKLKILKTLLSDIITDPEVIDLLQEEIDKLEKEKEDSSDTTELESSTEIVNDDSDMNLGDLDSSSDINISSGDIEADIDNLGSEESEERLPTPDELGVGDLTDNNNSDI